MLFNSFSFLFFYLPAVLAGFFLLGRIGPRWAALWLAAASLFFYGYWNLRCLPLLFGSIVFNFFCARAIDAAAGAQRRRRLIAAVAANLALLAYYKYANFFLASIGSAVQAQWVGWDIVLPIGISFFTFTQIAFLVDCYQGKVAEVRFVHYVLFVSYFPHLVAGPVLHHKEMMPQFADPRTGRPTAANFAVGLSIFVVGLAKKVLIADNLAPIANPVFSAGAHPAMIEAWMGTLAYTFQLYFDFSGYSDMAIGLSRLFGIALPLNFASPYKARDISQFWRCWHMTLSRFLRDYLYIPLGGSRAGTASRYRNLMATMLLGGLWHGAGWTFVLWGGLHGAYLVIHQQWRASCWATRIGRRRWWPPLAQAITFGAVMLAWVFFRADSFGTAFDVLAAMTGQHGLSLPHGLAAHAGWFSWLPVPLRFDGIAWIDFGGLGVPALFAAMGMAWLAPSTQQIFAHFAPALDCARAGTAARLRWAPQPAWGVALATLLVSCVFSMNRVSEFLYFQF